MRLVISDNEGAMAVVPLARDEISIGRKEGNTIRLTERNISRQHCCIQRVNGGYLIRDLDSYNGVLVNGQRVTGEIAVKPGDEIRVGDYTLWLEEAPQVTEPPPAAAADSRVAVPEAAAPQVSVTPSPSIADSSVAEPPPRLVVLSPPIAGAEFSLPEVGELRIGRAPDLDIAIEHRSVSREHARVICEAGEARIVDLGSVNGLIVNGEKVAEAKLRGDEKIELGDIHLRFVAAGQPFVFESAVADASRSRTLWTAAAIIAASIVLALLIVRWGGLGHEPSPVALGASQQVAARSSRPGEEAERAPTGAAGDPSSALLAACRRANEAERFAEAIANANAALKVHPGDSEAIECERGARVNHEQEQVSVRAKAALEQGDERTAWQEVSSLIAVGPVSRRPEVQATVALAVQMRLRQARELAGKRSADALGIAREVAGFALAPEAFREEARTLAAQIEAGQVRAGPAGRPRKSKLRAVPPEAAARISGAAPGSAPAVPPPASGSTAMDAASACLVRGDNACVVRALNGRAQTAQELGLLIETYRAMGNVEQAGRNMATFVQRFPTTNRAAVYRDLLQRTQR
jgi:pSer/pThr/pTyr-binding forkhead associated (FHA) protein